MSEQQYELIRDSKNAHQEHALALLRRWGYKPEAIRDHSLTAKGYEEMQFDPSGKGIIQDGSIVTVPRKWRSSFHWQDLKKHLQPTTIDEETE